MQIKVTEKHIKNGVPENCNLCAVSLALAEALFLDSHSVEVYPDHVRGVGYRFRFRSLDSDCGRLSYTMSDSDRDVVDSFIKEFDTFNYNDEKQQSYPTADIINAKPFTFELSGEVVGQNAVW